MAKPKSIHCVYFRVGKGQGKWGARISYQNATGTFPTIDAVKKWARNWARSINATITFEKL